MQEAATQSMTFKMANLPKRFFRLFGLVLLITALVTITTFKILQNGSTFSSDNPLTGSISTYKSESSSSLVKRIIIKDAQTHHQKAVNVSQINAINLKQTKPKASVQNEKKTAPLIVPKLSDKVSKNKPQETPSSSVIQEKQKQFTTHSNTIHDNNESKLSDSGTIAEEDQSSMERSKEVEANHPDGDVITPAEMKDAEKFVINKESICYDNGSSLDLLVAVMSAVKNFEPRKAIRETWGKLAVERGAALVFIVGTTANETITKELVEEDKVYEDVVQALFVDSYRNLTLKTVAMMNWVVNNCGQAKYVFKVDDDMFVNMQKLADFTEERNIKRAIIGRVGRHWGPQRSKKNKWYVPPQLYNRTVYPDFATGPAYIITGDVVATLLNHTKKIPPFYLEDVYTTGMVAEKAKVRRLHYIPFKNSHVAVNQCNIGTIITSHSYTPSQLRKLWRLVYEAPKSVCSKPKSKKTVQKKPKIH